MTDEPDHDGATHTIEVVFVNDGDTGDSTAFLDKVEFTPSATREEMYEIVDNDPPLTAEEEQKSITIVNGPESGWMPVKDEDGNITGVRSPDGTEGTSSTSDLDSVFEIGVVGSGEIKIDTITIPVKDPEHPSRNPDGGQLTIRVDDRVFEIPPVPDDSVSYTITTNGDTVVIENLVIKVTGEPDALHTVMFEYTRDADDPTGNTSAVIDHITWKSYGQNGKGGSSWLQGKALWIIDHEDPGDGWVYLAFRPELKVEEELTSWVKRSAANNMIRVKYGETRAEADACTPVIAHISDKPGHEIRPVKVWIKVSLNDLNQVTVVKPVGYWRIFIDGPAVQLSGTGGGSNPGLQTTPGPGLQDATPPIIGEGAVSVNTFGIVKVEVATTNTLIAVPWTWYSMTEQSAYDIPVKKLVKTTNLDVGDLLYSYQADGTYRAWMVADIEDESGERTWVPCKTVVVGPEGTGDIKVNVDDDQSDEMETVAEYERELAGANVTKISRGNAVWLRRQHPVDADGNPRPFWLYGQSVTTPVENVVAAPTGTQKYATTLLGNPYVRPVRVNDLKFEGTISTSDKIFIPNGTSTPKVLIYVKNRWRYTYAEKLEDGSVRNAYDYNVVIPAGLGFWIDRRGKTPLKITWPKPQE